MNNTNGIICKVAPRGEGKTRWLIARAEEEIANDSTVYMITDNSSKYLKFAKTYFNLLQKVCPVTLATELNTFSEGAVILVDNLFEEKFSAKELGYLSTKHRVYVTIEGTEHRAYTVLPQDEQYEQLTMEELLNA